MALRGPERAVGAVMALLEADLTTYCQQLEIEAADGIAQPGVETWLNCRAGKMFGDTTQVNVWCEGFSTPSWESEASRFAYSQDGPFSADYEIRVMLSHSNRAMLSFGAMELRSQRYAAAILRCLTRQHQTLLTGGVAFVRQVEFEMNSQLVGEAETLRRVDSIICSLVLAMSEDNSNENTAGGGGTPGGTYVYDQIRT